MKQGIHIGTSRQIIVCLHLLVDYLAIVTAEHTALWLQGMFRVEASRMMVLPWEYQYIYYLFLQPEYPIFLGKRTLDVNNMMTFFIVVFEVGLVCKYLLALNKIIY